MATAKVPAVSTISSLIRRFRLLSSSMLMYSSVSLMYSPAHAILDLLIARFSTLHWPSTTMPAHSCIASEDVLDIDILPMARPHNPPNVKPDATALQHSGLPCRYQVETYAGRTHGHEAIVEGVDLHEVGLQQVLHSFNALLAVLFLRRLLSRVLGAPALLQSLAVSQPVSRRGPISTWPEACFSPISDPCPRYIEVPIPPCRTA